MTSKQTSTHVYIQTYMHTEMSQESTESRGICITLVMHNCSVVCPRHDMTWLDFARIESTRLEYRNSGGEQFSKLRRMCQVLVRVNQIDLLGRTSRRLMALGIAKQTRKRK